MKKLYVIVTIIFTILTSISFTLFSINRGKHLFCTNVEALTQYENTIQTDCINCENSYCELKVRLVGGEIKTIRLWGAIHFVLCK